MIWQKLGVGEGEVYTACVCFDWDMHGYLQAWNKAEM